MITTKQINKKYFSDNIETLFDYDKAILGVDLATKKVSYSISKMIEVFMDDVEKSSSFDEAVTRIKCVVKNCSNQYNFVDDIF